jgi:hypothetical protein
LNEPQPNLFHQPEPKLLNESEPILSLESEFDFFDWQKMNQIIQQSDEDRFKIKDSEMTQSLNEPEDSEMSHKTE